MALDTRCKFHVDFANCKICYPAEFGDSNSMFNWRVGAGK